MKKGEENDEETTRIERFQKVGGRIYSLSLIGLIWPLAAQAALPTIPAFPGADYNVLDPAAIPKFVQPLVIPPVMPKSTDPKADYNIAMRQFQQQILPGGIWKLSRSD